MKTTVRLLLIAFAVTVYAGAYAQNSVNDLFNTYVIVPAQQRIQILTNEINQLNGQIQDLQRELADSNTPAAVTADAGGNPDEVSPPSPLVAQIAELQARGTELQNGLSYWQTQLAAWLAFNTQQQEQYLLANSDQILAATGQNVSAMLTGQNQNEHLGPMPDPNNPWVVPVFVSSGDAGKDSQLIMEWLVQHGLMKSE